MTFFVNRGSRWFLFQFCDVCSMWYGDHSEVDLANSNDAKNIKVEKS
jgi:hypothetical protein